MPSAEHGGADGHEVCDCVVAIADELFIMSFCIGGEVGRGAYFLEIVCDESLVGLVSEGLRRGQTYDCF